MKFYTVYETTNKINGKNYIGKHKTNDPHDKYLGSGTDLKQDIIKYGKENFEKVVLHIFDNEKDMNKAERELVNRDVVLNETTYNLTIGGAGGFDFLNDGSIEHIERCKKGRILANDAMKEKYGENYLSIVGKKGL